MAGREPDRVLRPWDGGRKGFREPGEPTDERPRIRRDPFWEDLAGRAAWESAVRERPIRQKFEDGHFAGYAEGALEYLQEIVKRATGRQAEVQAMPQSRIPGEEG